MLQFCMLIHKIQRKFFNMNKFQVFSKLKYQIFLHIYIVPIMCECGKVKKALGNKIAITI